MAQHKVLTRRSSSVEALGAVRVLCTDKTGTLTQNRMMVSDLIADGTQVSVTEIGPTDLPDPIHRLVEWAILASRVNPFDPMERAFNALGQRFLSNTEHLHADWTLIRLYPLQSNLLAMSQLWQRPGSTDYQVAAKGAPEAIAGLCHLSEAQLVSIRRDVERLAQQGRRVLGVAQAIWSGAQAPLVQSDIDFQFIGLVGLADPIRPEVPAAVATCAKAGIRVVMITGDHPGTALAIAHQAGIATAGVLTGDEISRMDKKTLADRLRQTNVFARIMPEQKLLLVTAFSAAGDVVAMTGDGVNDAPSLKAAHIGVAMGQRGTDVAREAASLVLLDDNFASLIDAIRLGRRIDDNLRKAISYILAVHVPIAGMSLVPVLLGWLIILGPIHVVFLELIIDPVSSIVFEAESAEPGIMERPPRAPGAPLFTTELLLHGLIQGSVVLAATLGIFFLGLRDIHGTEVSRCMAFVTLVIGNLGLVLTNRSIHKSAFAVLFQPNPALLVVAAITAAALSLALSLSWLRELFGFAALSFSQLGEALGAAIAATIFNDLTGIAWGLLAKRNGSHKDSL
jgi:Ca2+-transporting ATPase